MSDTEPADDLAEDPNETLQLLHGHVEFKAWMKERQVIAWERIADALERIAGKETNG